MLKIIVIVLACASSAWCADPSSFVMRERFDEGEWSAFTRVEVDAFGLLSRDGDPLGDVIRDAGGWYVLTIDGHGAIVWNFEGSSGVLPTPTGGHVELRTPAFEAHRLNARFVGELAGMFFGAVLAYVLIRASGLDLRWFKP